MRFPPTPPAPSCWRPSSTRSRTPYSAFVVKIISPNPTAPVGEGSASSELLLGDHAAGGVERGRLRRLGILRDEHVEEAQRRQPRVTPADRDGRESWVDVEGRAVRRT